MKEINCEKIKEKAYIEKLENGLEIIIIPKQNTKKKYVMFGTRFGSIDNRFIMQKTGEEVFIPDGVAHFLEHKMFEQENGKNSLDVLMALGIDANAYTTNDHTTYLFECTDHFYEGLDELMDYVQHPYFTDENVEKEKGIIGQEITMYDDDPGWQLYMGAMDCLYKNNPIKIDIAGTIESISKITPEVLNKCYNTFYNPSNMVLVACGDFNPENLLQEIKNRLVKKEEQGLIKRIYPEEENTINKKKSEKNMEISMPIFMIGYKDKIIDDKKEVVKRHVAIEILLNMILGESSELYSRLYDSGDLLMCPDFDYEFSKQYAHVLISGHSNNPEKIMGELTKEIEKFKAENINSEELSRIKKKIYGEYVTEYNNVADISRMFFADWIKGINSFEYIEVFKEIDAEYVKKVLKEIFAEENMVLSVIKGNNK